MADYDYGYPSPSPSPPPADGHTDHMQHASISDLFLELRRRANTDGHSPHRQQQQQHVQVISSDPRQLIASVREADGTTTKKVVFIFNKPRHRDAACPGHHHGASTTATPYLANTNGHSGHRQQQQQEEMHVINMDHRIPPVREPDGTTRRCVIMTNRPAHCPEASTTASPRRRHRANTATSPYHPPEHHESWSNRRRRRSPAPHLGDYEGATKVVCLAKMLSPGHRLQDDRFYQVFVQDVTEEAQKFGDLVNVVIPRPGLGGGRAASVVAGVGKVFLEYRHLDDAAWCRKRLDGRWYSGKEIAATFFSHDRFAAGDYDYDG